MIDTQDILPVENIKGSGGGCFPAGTMVFTSHGYKQIERIRVHDMVVSFDDDHVINYGLVEDVYVHTSEDFQDGLLEFTYTLNGEELKLQVTPNHYIYDETSSFVVDDEGNKLIHFKRADDFNIGEYLTTYNDKACEITDIKVILLEDLSKDFKVYNLNVTLDHTYCVAGNKGEHSDEYGIHSYVGIKVHNGGGGKGSSAPAAVEDPNTLQSAALARVVEFVSAGEVGGLVNGLKSVYFNDTPVQNADGTNNFGNVVYEFRYGLASQTPMKGFPAVENEVVVDIEITPTISHVYTVNDNTIDALRVTISLPNGLHYQEAASGSLHGYSVQLAFDTRPIGVTTWTQVKNPVIPGKAMSLYESAWRIDKPTDATNGFEVRVRRISAVDPGANYMSITKWARATEINDIKIAYNNAAYVGMVVDARTTGNVIPSRAYDMYGIKIQIPINYDPVTRTYTGVWDGTFKRAVCDNPAWIIYDLITNKLYGYGNFLASTSIDKASFYSAAQYNDQLVNDGHGGTEPRFTWNGVINTRQQAWQLIQLVASSCRSIVYPGSIIALIQDRPSTPVKLVTNANVIDGLFTYASTGLTNRSTVANVTYNNILDKYLPYVITYEDTASINRYGYNITDVVAYGAVTEGQARRFGIAEVLTAVSNNEVVTYQTGFAQADLIPGDVIRLMDNDYAGAMFAGRIVGGTTTSVQLDRSVTLKSGSTYTISILDADGKTIVNAIVSSTSPGTYTTLNIASTLTNSAATLQGREWMIYSSSDVMPRLFRVANIKESSKGIFDITGIFYDANKYTVIDGGVTNPAEVYSQYATNTTPQPYGLTYTVQGYNDNTNTAYTRLLLKWSQPTTVGVSYEVRWNINNGPTQIINNIQVPDFTIDKALNGTYAFVIIAINVAGVRSVPLAGTYDLTSTSVSSLLDVTNLYVKGRTDGTFASQDCTITWTDPNVPGVNNPVILDYVVEVWDSVSTNKKSTFSVPANKQEFTYTFIQNRADFTTPVRSFEFKVFVRETTGKISVGSTLVVNNPPPPVVDLSVISGINTAWVTINTATTTVDGASYVVWRDTVSGFTPSGLIPGGGNCVYNGTSSQPALNIPVQNTTYYYKAAQYDNFGTDSYNVTGDQVSTSLGDNFYAFSFDSITFTPNSPSNNSVAWTSGTAGVTHSNNTTTYSISSGNVAWTSGIVYIYYKAGQTTLQTTTSLIAAMLPDSIVVAIYKGGTDIVANYGRAVLDGSYLIAGTVGANSIVAGAAVITGSAQIANAVITSAHMVDLTLDTINIKQGAINDTRFFSSNSSSSSQATTSGGSLVNVSSPMTGTLLTWTTPNPIGINGPFPTMFVTTGSISNTQSGGTALALGKFGLTVKQGTTVIATVNASGSTLNDTREIVNMLQCNLNKNTTYTLEYSISAQVVSTSTAAATCTVTVASPKGLLITVLR